MTGWTTGKCKVSFGFGDLQFIGGLANIWSSVYFPHSFNMSVGWSKFRAFEGSFIRWQLGTLLSISNRKASVPIKDVDSKLSPPKKIVMTDSFLPVNTTHFWGCFTQWQTQSLPISQGNTPPCSYITQVSLALNFKWPVAESFHSCRAWLLQCGPLYHNTST